MKTIKVQLETGEWVLDVEKALKSGVLKPVIRRHVGQHYRVNNAVNLIVYVVAVVNNRREVVLIDVMRGTWWRPPVVVGSIHSITPEEWSKIAGTWDMELVQPCKSVWV